MDWHNLRCAGCFRKKKTMENKDVSTLDKEFWLVSTHVSTFYIIWNP